MAKRATRREPAALPDRDQILAFIRENEGKVGKREIARAFGLTGADKIPLKQLLKELAEDGTIERSGRRVAEAGQLPSVLVLTILGPDVDGELLAAPADWSGDGAPPRIRIEPAARRKGAPLKRPGAAPGIGDRVLARLTPDDEGGGFRARVMKVLDRLRPATLGIFREVGGEGRVTPINRRDPELVIPADSVNGARGGELVRVEAGRAGRFGLVRGRVVERVADLSSEAAISLIALEEHGIPYVFPPEALAEAEAAQPAGPAGREDWRSLPLVTIDPADARDHDDAVHAAPDPDSPDGFVVTVAIADVAFYVRAGSALDREAVRRGNSVYFPGRVVPMLPERISNDLCSLRENEDRPALAVRMRFDAQGRKRGHSFHRILMRSHAKLAYEQAQAAIDGAPDAAAATILDTVLRPLWAAYAALAKARDAREPLAIDLPERKVILTPTGGVDRVVVPPRLDAHRLIEEFMIQANVAAAEELEARRRPLVYRVHDEPSLDKLEALRDFLGSLDMSFPKAGSLRPAQFNRVLKRAEGTPDATQINEVVLRSQSQAVYATDNLGHFGLNLRRYAHFTSPIRRYADLLVHRSLISALGFGSDGMRPGEEAGLARIAGEISIAERRAMAAERDTVDRLVATWLESKIGATFHGRIRGVTRAGLFVELADTGADGFVPISTLGADFYEHEPSRHRLIGRKTGETFRLGDAVEVRLAEALPFAGSLRLELLRERSGDAPGRPPDRGRRKDPRRGTGAPARPARTGRRA